MTNNLVFSTVVFPQPDVDSFASISEVDILGLLQNSYASGIMPDGDCPEGMYRHSSIFLDRFLMLTCAKVSSNMPFTVLWYLYKNPLLGG